MKIWYNALITIIIILFIMFNIKISKETDLNIINDINSLRKNINTMNINIKSLFYSNFNLKQEINQLKIFNDKLIKLEMQSNKIRIIKTTVTYYCPWAMKINSDSDPNNTALMTIPKPGYTIAISKELVEKGWLGHKVYIEGFGIGKIEDRMGRSVTGIHIDICVGTEKEAIELGKRLNVTMVKLI